MRECSRVKREDMILYARDLQVLDFVLWGGRRFPSKVAAMAALAAFRSLYDAIDPEMQEVLKAHGLTESFQLANAIAVDETEDSVWIDMVASIKDYDTARLYQHLHDFGLLIASAKRAQGWQARQHAHAPLSRLASEAESKRRRLQTEELERRLLGVGAPSATASAAPLPALTARRRHSLGPVARAAAPKGSASQEEQQLRQRLLDELVDLLLRLGGPVIEQARQTADPRAVLRLVAGGKRARTLRARLRAWRAFAAWLDTAHHEAWPSSWSRVIDYGQVRADEPCGKQTLLGVFAAVRFVESASGFHADRQVTTSTLYAAAAKELLSGITARARGGGPRPANRPLVAQLLWLERSLMDEDNLMWIRGYCFWKLLQTWACLRFDDHRGLAPSSMVLADGSLTAVLKRTKTTGGDKRIAERIISVSGSAYLEQDRWLAVGLDIWRQIAPAERDYLLGSPCADFTQVQSRELSYAAAAGWSRALTFQFVDSLGAGAVADVVGRHYTEHSHRAWLPSAAQALGASEAQLEVLGGWRAAASRAYMRAAPIKMRLIQSEVARVARQSLGGKDVLGERQLHQELCRHVSAQGHAADYVIAVLSPLVLYPLPHDDVRRWSIDVDAAADGRPSQGSADAAEPGQARRASAPSEGHRVRRLPEEVKGYVVSISGKHGFRRLHLLGRCHRVLGVDYACYEELGSEMPGPSQYDDVCGQCWRRGQSVRTDGAPAHRGAAGSASCPPVAVSSSKADATGSASEGTECSADDSSSTDADVRA